MSHKKKFFWFYYSQSIFPICFFRIFIKYKKKREKVIYLIWTGGYNFRSLPNTFFRTSYTVHFFSEWKKKEKEKKVIIINKTQMCIIPSLHTSILHFNPDFYLQFWKQKKSKKRKFRQWLQKKNTRWHTILCAQWEHLYIMVKK